MAEWTRKSMYGVYSLSFEVPQSEGGDFILVVNGATVYKGKNPSDAYRALTDAFPRQKFGVVARRHAS